ncbi:MAG: PGF-pre-PGF domain-containing protein, partial [Candidatus Hadarchaeales archaeon]
RVRVRDGAGNENVSSVFTFELLIPPSSQVSPISPYWWRTSPIPISVSASDADGTVTRVELWYRWSPDNSSWGSWILYDYDTTPPYSFSFMPPSGQGYYEFYSRARDNAGNYESPPPQADARCGHDTTPPSAPSLLQPEEGATVGVAPTFSWATVPDPSGVTYELEVDNEPTFTDPLVYRKLGLTENFHICENSLDIGTYYWRVRAVDGAQNVGDWSENRCFTVGRFWYSLESWQVPASAAPAWRTVEAWSVVSALPAWRTIEAHSVEVSTLSVWASLEWWSGEAMFPGWVLVDSRGGRMRAPIGFDLSLSPATGEVSQGGSINVNINVTKSYPSYNRTVALEIRNLPPGASASFSGVLQGVPDFSLTLTVSTSSTTPLGTYLIQVVAGDGVVTLTKIFALTVRPPPPPPPPKYPPVSRVKPISPFWYSSLPVTVEAEASDSDGAVVGVTLYYRHSRDNSAWGSWKLWGEDNSYPWVWSFSPPEKDGYYEFYSVAVDNDGLVENAPSVADASLGLDLTAPPVPTPLSPVGGTLVGARVTLVWQAVQDLSGIEGYEVEVDENEQFPSPLLSTFVRGTSLEFDLPAEGRFFWRVRAVNGSGLSSPWSTSATFISISRPPIQQTRTFLSPFAPADFDFTPYEPYFIRKVTLVPAGALEQMTVSVFEFKAREFTELFSWLPEPEYMYTAWLSLDVPKTLVQRTEVSFQVYRSWLEERGLDENTVVLQRVYLGEWENIPAELVGWDEERFYYKATFSGFYDILSCSASKKAAPPPPPPPPPPVPKPPYLLYAFLTILGGFGIGFAYFLYQRRLAIPPAVPVERIARAEIPPALRPTALPAISLEKLGPKPTPEILPIPTRLSPLKVRPVFARAVPVGQVLEAIKRVRPIIPLERVAKVAKPPVPPAVELEKLAKEVKPLAVREVKGKIQEPSDVLSKLRELTEGKR